MIYIAHRGNLVGPNPDKENSPRYIQDALSAGFFCEVDLWKLNGDLGLGHEGPEHLINIAFLRKRNLVIHAKNLDALSFLRRMEDVESPEGFHYFFHEGDKATLTSRGLIWYYPTQNPRKDGIVLMPEQFNQFVFEKDEKPVGVCSDFVQEIRDLNG